MKYFKDSEFKTCDQGCCDVGCATELMEKCDAIRAACGFPLVITSGYRCERRNAEVGGSKDSSHVKGLAADISCVDSAKRLKILSAAIACGVTRIGVAKSFIHIDIDKDKPSCVWTY